MSGFSLSEYLTKFQTTDRESYPRLQDPSRELNVIIDQLAVSPEQIDASPDSLEALIDLCHDFPHLTPKLQTQLSYLISSSLSNLSKDIKANLSSNVNFTEIGGLIPQWKRHLEEYGYLIQVLLTFLQDELHKVSSQSTNLNRSAKNSKNDSANVELFKRDCNQMENLLESITKLLEINLSKIFQTTPEKDLFIGLFTRPLFVLLEIEPVTKVSSLKMFIQRILAMCVKNHGQSSSIQSSLMTNLTYFLHLSVFNAELLKLLNDEYNYPQLTEDILKEISTRVFNAKDTTGPKAISNFLIKLSELSPGIMLRQMNLVITLLNNSSITLRCSVVEACGNIVAELAQDPQTMEHYKQQIAVLIELLEERFQDSNPYVRTKAIQGCSKICDLSSKFNKSKAKFTSLAVRSLQDRSSLVRRNSVKLLSKLLLKHPFKAIHGSQLRLSEWEEYLKGSESQLNSTLKKVESQETLNDTIERSLIEEEVEQDEGQCRTELEGSFNKSAELSRIENEVENINTATNTSVLMKLKLMIVYYKDAISFIKEIHKSIELISNLLFSKNRNEVLESMDFLVLADAFDIELSEFGIKKMLHLVWMKGTNDEGTSISVHLIECYKQLFLTAPDSCNMQEKAAHIAKNLINLSIGASIADLASLEQLLGMMYEQKLIDQHVINILWAIYNSASKASMQKEQNVNNRDSEKGFSKEQIHGSIIILGMLSLADNEIALKGLESLLNIGLGAVGLKDLTLCRYSCLALERMVPKRSTIITKAINQELEDVAVKKLYAIIINYTKDNEYYPMCEQALSALFTISSKPDILATDLIREKTMMTFGKPEEEDSILSLEQSSRVVSLSQLLFIVGQVAIKTLVYLEKCEAEFKKRKIEAETRNGKVKNQGADVTNTTQDNGGDKELEMIGGTNEDDFTDAIQFVKENELLFGEKSILGKFCPIVEEIVSNSSRFSDPMLQRTATLCLEKLMCLSSKYCEKSLPLLITVMEKSPDPTIRSNAVLGLGDMAVCFNNLVDENTDYLYRRLHDENLMVQRTCLMTVTFLILAGQVKVKGQLGEMAKCLDNPDQGISDMCRLFFTELASKDNAIYNGFIDIFSNLSSDDLLGKESFKKIIKFLLTFIDKERHQKQLNEKLVGRLRKCETQKQWDDIAFVLNNLPYKNEDVTALLEQGFKVVSAKE
ncbi:Ycs4p [Saccharomyces cerevisiae YJM1419]|uniref:Condensin complex subunit 1 n=1 Tax=Saccharomyces cerevisiae (strain JAY291) TaxID=574961 RepID=C7GQW9_YEAS2|nr:Ycs4p [Saccharomyces cerevisiae YJM1190]AJV48585.1 Ycs4p [Saccharomyces cerevisiae YJM1202]AJV50357.1 Ycs4p [Saccharomyces cerevisiae YJM1248]AJV55739.1 Ycs4p [Saccharomyces cerevisiae YJM1342]AJV60680.1 Ycs4p [Saccharomyces cerevisiae YJM1400]AJV63386.1 Ycs4p [Saccharomyces cerevisiae YJM1419]AJV64707.1 Ycs4p [Saccharomyces cerevisiae YJM1439]AJV68706.1 Ycs4p [Saccharomyces cerevisiae YJM1479]AJV70059.1 Ycs4p [Saccharomyces cerevisiae YJM1549]AJV75742.1 Ycs4p [Saccharomyces cerevisiae 